MMCFLSLCAMVAGWVMHAGAAQHRQIQQRYQKVYLVLWAGCPSGSIGWAKAVLVLLVYTRATVFAMGNEKLTALMCLAGDSQTGETGLHAGIVMQQECALQQQHLSP